MASRLTSHARELSGALCRLQATSQSLGRPISLAMAEEALADLIRHSGRAVRLARHREGRLRRLWAGAGQPAIGRARRKRVSHPRMLAMWLARKHTRAALSEIGHYLRPPQPQHGDFGPEAGGRLDGLRPAAGPGRAPLAGGRRHSPGRAATAGRVKAGRRRRCEDELRRGHVIRWFTPPARVQ